MFDKVLLVTIHLANGSRGPLGVRLRQNIYTLDGLGSNSNY